MACQPQRRSEVYENAPGHAGPDPVHTDEDDREELDDDTEIINTEDAATA